MGLRLVNPTPPELCPGSVGFVKGHNRYDCPACDARAAWEYGAKPYLPARARKHPSSATRADWEHAEAAIAARRAKLEAAYAAPLPRFKLPKPVLDYGSLVLEYPVEGYLRAVGAAPIRYRQYECWGAGGRKVHTVGLEDPPEWPCGHHPASKDCGRLPETWGKKGGPSLTEVTVYFVQLAPGYWSSGTRWDCGCITDRHEAHLGGGYYGKANHVVACARHARALTGLNEDGTRRVEAQDAGAGLSQEGGA